MKLEIGDRFYHAREWDEYLGAPMICKVVQVTDKKVRWIKCSRARTISRTRTFPLAEIDQYVLRVLPFGTVTHV